LSEEFGAKTKMSERGPSSGPFHRGSGGSSLVGLRSSLLNSAYSIEPEPSGSKESKRASISARGAATPSAGIALRNSLLVTVPSPSSSHSRNRSITRTAFAFSSSWIC